MLKLQRDFYSRDTLDVARDLLGKHLVRVVDGHPLACRITETEAYIGRIDKACHAYGCGTRIRPASDLKDSRPSVLSVLPGASTTAPSVFWDVNLSKPEVLQSFEAAGHVAGKADEAALLAQGNEDNEVSGRARPSKPGWIRVPQPCGYKRTPRTETLFAPPGTAYIYLIYGMYDCLNFVTEPEGEPCAVLIRAVEPLEECLDAVSHNRYGCGFEATSAYQRKNFMNGPGKLCKGLSLSRKQNGLDLTGSELYVLDAGEKPGRINISKRIGIDYAQEAVDFPWRFWT